MPPVDPISLSSVRTFTKLSAAPMGTLLQVASIRAGTPHAVQVFAVVGMHCEQRTNDERTTRGLLLLEGDDAGLLVTGLRELSIYVDAYMTSLRSISAMLLKLHSPMPLHGRLGKEQRSKLVTSAM